jgi:alpha 1,2-mannosyltransferase
MKTCFVLLLPNNLRHHLLNKSLSSLYNFYLRSYPTDVVIFHEIGFSVNNKQTVKNLLPNTNVIFKEIQFSVPNIILNDKDFKPKWTDTYWWPEKCLSYGGMCTFFGFDIFSYLDEMGYDYYARLDDDSYFLNPINYNIFEFMKDNNLTYGYLIKMLEAPHVVQGLFNFIIDNVDPNGVLDTKYRFIEDREMVYYYNNFEIVNIKKYYTNQVKEINKKIHESGNVYYYRWGDAPIRTILLSIFFDKNQIKRLPNVDYQHHQARIINNIVYDASFGVND